MNKFYCIFLGLNLAFSVSGLNGIEDNFNDETEIADNNDPVSLRPISPFKASITGVGIVEAGSDNISIGIPVQRIVEQVLVQVGSEVKKNQVLLKLDDRDLLADLNASKAAYEIALAKFYKLKALPRKEDIISADASAKTSQLEMEKAKNQYEMAQGLRDTRAISLEEMNRRQFNYQQAEAKWQETLANLDKIKSGTWEPDLEIAWLEVQQAKANKERIDAEIQRTIVRSPIDGKVLQLRIHEGEFPAPDTNRTPMIVVGDTEEKKLRVSINQFNAPYFNPQSTAVAFLQGDGRFKYELEFVHLEPYLVNKQNATNDIRDRTDTKVLQVIYRFKEVNPHIYVGQQMDVFIESQQTP